MEDSKKKGISGIMNILKSSNNRLYKLLLILLSGICLMIVVWPANNSKTDKNDLKSGWTGQSDETDADVTGGNDRNMSGDTTDYVEYMEERLTSVLEQVDGISDVRVMITVKDSGENIALKDSGGQWELAVCGQVQGAGDRGCGYHLQGGGKWRYNAEDNECSAGII